ncbi:UDP-N-acetylglucosamine transferase subunit ALG14 [Schleiferiaceae bacterium]|nr:UDP-N-acetylglucosamine transferase subunit ALG14 [Schleiferiaceae bacterium]
MKKVLIVSSLGGHLVQMKNFYLNSPDNVSWILVTESRVGNMKVDWFQGKMYKIFSHKKGILNYFGLLINVFFALKILFQERPDFICSTGSHTAIPFFVVAKLFNIHTVFILSYARRRSRAKSADVIYYLANTFVVQWEEALKNYPKALYLGSSLYL